jgi:hypothetical protein
MTLRHVKHLDLAGWLYGLGHAAIGGGASAVVAGFSASVIAPAEIPFGGLASFKLMGLCFLVNALLSGFMYLKQSPLPEIVEESDGLGSKGS